MTSQESFDEVFNNNGFASADSRRVQQFIPGYTLMQRLTTQLLSEQVADDGCVLVLGAGGGLELDLFCRLRPKWTFIGIDPSAAMLDMAKTQLGERAHRVKWVEGYIADAPAKNCDGGSCLFTLHAIADYGIKLETLKEIRSRLKPGAPFIIADSSFDFHDSDIKDKQTMRYAQFAQDSGASETEIEQGLSMVEKLASTISPQREEALLHEAGFSQIELIFVALSWHGWVCRA